MTPLSVNIYWFLLPLVVAISLVYAASRHEDWRRIRKQAAGCCTTIVVILVVATILLTIINSLV